MDVDQISSQDHVPTLPPHAGAAIVLEQAFNRVPRQAVLPPTCVCRELGYKA